MPNGHPTAAELSSPATAWTRRSKRVSGLFLPLSNHPDGVHLDQMVYFVNVVFNSDRKLDQNTSVVLARFTRAQRDMLQESIDSLRGGRYRGLVASCQPDSCQF